MINDYDERDGQGPEGAAADLKQLFKLNRINSRHFAVDNDIANGTASTDY
jgi:hypothetical protein